MFKLALNVLMVNCFLFIIMSILSLFLSFLISLLGYYSFVSDIVKYILSIFHCFKSCFGVFAMHFFFFLVLCSQMYQIFFYCIWIFSPSGSIQVSYLSFPQIFEHLQSTRHILDIWNTAVSKADGSPCPLGLIFKDRNSLKKNKKIKYVVYYSSKWYRGKEYIRRIRSSGVRAGSVQFKTGW